MSSGFGRVIETLLNHNCKADITGIERSKPLFEYLKKHYGENVALLNEDFLTTQLIKGKFEVILFLWSALSDFSRHEQPVVIQKLSQFLTPKGILVIDSIPSDLTPIHSIQIEPQDYQIEYAKQKGFIYMPSNEQINEYAKEAKLQRIKLIHFKTDKGRPRYLHILSK